MTIESVSFSCDEIDRLESDEKIGNLGKHNIFQDLNNPGLSFFPFEKKYPIAWFRPEAFLAMTRCTRVEIEGKADTPIGTFEAKITIYGDSDRSVENENTGDADRNHAPDSRDRDFDRNEVDR